MVRHTAVALHTFVFRKCVHHSRAGHFLREDCLQIFIKVTSFLQVLLELLQRQRRARRHGRPPTPPPRLEQLPPPGLPPRPARPWFGRRPPPLRPLLRLPAPPERTPNLQVMNLTPEGNLESLNVLLVSNQGLIASKTPAARKQVVFLVTLDQMPENLNSFRMLPVVSLRLAS